MKSAEDLGKQLWIAAIALDLSTVVETIEARDQEHAAARDRLIESLHRIAAWHDGDLVTGKFDEPCAAREARAALGAIGIWGPQPNERSIDE